MHTLTDLLLDTHYVIPVYVFFFMSYTVVYVY